jgi:hypothetical protein
MPELQAVQGEGHDLPEDGGDEGCPSEREHDRDVQRHGHREGDPAPARLAQSHGQRARRRQAEQRPEVVRVDEGPAHQRPPLARRLVEEQDLLAADGGLDESDERDQRRGRDHREHDLQFSLAA